MNEPLNLTVQRDDGGFPYARVYEVLNSLDAKSVPEPLAVSAHAQLPGAPGRKLPSVSTAALTLLAAGFAFGWLHTRGSMRSAAVAAAPSPSATGIGMKVQSQGDGLLVTWNRKSPPVQTSKDGVLVIKDGVQLRRLALDRTDIESGSVLYRPQSKDVDLTLNLTAAQGSVITENVRVLDGTGREKSANATTPRRVGKLPSAPAVKSARAPVVTPKPDPKSVLRFVQPVPLKQVMPDIRAFGISTLDGPKDVAVKVAIDNQGRVTRAEISNTEPRIAGLLTSAALAAARQWIFQPATIRSVRVASGHTIVFHFAGQSH